MYGLRYFGFKKSNTIFVYFNTVPNKLQSYTNFDVRPVTSMKKLRNELEAFDHIVFHSLYPHYLSLIPRLSGKRLSWVFWGYEYYNYFETNYFERETKRILPRRSIIKYVTRWIRKQQLKKALKKIDFFLFWDRIFYNKLKQKFNLKAEFHEFLYCRSFFEKIELPNEKESKADGFICYVGNSGYLSGNQPDVYKKISSIKNIRTVYSLLAYGNEAEIKRIEQSAKKYLNNHIPIKEFLPFDKYIQMMNNIDIVICYHNRMQALGLIFNAILLKKRLVLNEKNNFKRILKSIGIQTFNLEDIEWFDKKKEIKQLDQNRKLLLQYFNRDRLYHYYSVFSEN